MISVLIPKKNGEYSVVKKEPAYANVVDLSGIKEPGTYVTGSITIYVYGATSYLSGSFVVTVEFFKNKYFWTLESCSNAYQKAYAITSSLTPPTNSSNSSTGWYYTIGAWE